MLQRKELQLKMWLMQWLWYSCYIHTPVYDVCRDSMLCSGGRVCDVIGWAAALLQMDV